MGALGSVAENQSAIYEGPVLGHCDRIGDSLLPLNFTITITITIAITITITITIADMLVFIVADMSITITIFIITIAIAINITISVVIYEVGVIIVSFMPTFRRRSELLKSLCRPER